MRISPAVFGFAHYKSGKPRGTIDLVSTFAPMSLAGFSVGFGVEHRGPYMVFASVPLDYCSLCAPVFSAFAEFIVNSVY
jgi:hypothetical protein